MKTPWHLWVVGVVGLLWHLIGAADYTLTQYEYEPYMAQFTEEQRTYFQSFPIWVVATWAFAIWLSVAGSLLLLMKSRIAALAFGVALICIVVTAVHNFGLAETTMTEIAGDEAIWVSLAIFAVGAFHWLYAREMNKRGVLE